METNVCNEWFFKLISWTHNDVVDGDDWTKANTQKLVEDFQCGLINCLAKGFSQPKYECDKSVVFKSGILLFGTKCDKWIHFLSFSPIISGKYLFIFYNLEEDNICLLYKLILRVSPT